MRLYLRTLRIPALVMIGITIVVFLLTRRSSIVEDGTFLGLLSQFDGTATTVFVALATLRSSSDEKIKAAYALRRSIQIRFAGIFALISFVIATTSVHYKFLGAWALALNVATVAAIAWGLVGARMES
ncbi:hypothetical protein [Herbidospora mongoliensis]|uniref:hypothetical protein n=1 Tax=Herbidospora mongoliensis TaxID=688067 RepID=UPI0012F98A8C|nr:hypothetical protein [Herbidospora mongoliensis]